MKKAWVFLIVGFVLFIVFGTIAGIQLWQFYSATPDEREHIMQTMSQMIDERASKEDALVFAKEVVMAVMKDWQLETYLKYADAATMTDKDKQILSWYLSKTGPEYGAIQKMMSITETEFVLRGTSVYDAYLYAEYEIKAVFATKGEKVFRVSLGKDRKTPQWYIESLHQL